MPKDRASGKKDVTFGKLEKVVRQMKATAPLHELAYRMAQDPNYKPSLETQAVALGSAMVGLGIVKPKQRKRYFVSEGVIDGYAACLVMETNLGGEPFGVARCLHPLTKKAAELARLFIASMPAPTGETKMAIARQTPLSVSKKADNPLTNIVEPRDRKRDKDSDFYIQAGGNDSFELNLWTSVALSACDQFQERRIRRKR